MTVSYDELLGLLRQRRSCRAFRPEPPDGDTLAKLARAFAAAPAAGGDRELRCRFIADTAVIRSVAEAGAAAFGAVCDRIDSPIIRENVRQYGKNFFWFASAPALAVVTYRRPPAFMAGMAIDNVESLWGGEASAAMAVFAMLVAAESLGLGACCLTGPLAVRATMESLFAVPPRERLAMLVALGKPL